MSIDRPSQLVFIRHAESARNRAKPKGAVYFADDEARRTVKGIADYKIPLTREGMEQARKTGLCLRQRFGVPDYFYHSGYLRAVQTVAGIMETFASEECEQIKVRMNQFIRERDPGYAYDMTTQEAEAAFPWLREHWKTFGGFFSRPPGGESLSDVSQRVYTFLNTLFRDRAGMNVWAVVHGGTLRAIRFLLEHWDYEQALRWGEGQTPENCGITVYKFDDSRKRLVLSEYNTACWR